MVGAISSISSLFVGSIAPRALASSSSAPSSSTTSTNSITGVTDPQDVIAISGVQPPDPVSRDDGSQKGEDQNQQGQGQGQQQPQQQTSVNPSQKKLSQDQQDQVAKLKQIDRSVHLHEQAHAAAGGSLAGAPHYSYTTGPDGNQYATGGEVAISVPSINSKDPQATIQQLRTVIAAATAPADPSGQDRAVAAQATAEIAQAQADATKAAASGTDSGDSNPSASGSDKSKSTTDGTGQSTAAPKTTTTTTPSAASSSTATTGADDTQEPSIPIIGPAAFGTKKTADSSTTSGQSSGSTGDTSGSSGTKASAALIYAYQQVQSSTGQSRNRAASALNLSV